MMTYLPELLTVFIIHLFAVIIPGPDFAMISRNSFVYSRKTGMCSAIGLALGIIVHVTYSLVGIGFIIARSTVLFSVLKYLGAGYLIYIGYKSLRAKPVITSSNEIETKEDISKFAAIRMGFFSNILNPKVTLFFLALFTQVINPETPVVIKIIYGLGMSTMTFVWFSFVATVLTHKTIKVRFASIRHYIERTLGAILIALGIKVALLSSK